MGSTGFDHHGHPIKARRRGDRVPITYVRTGVWGCPVCDNVQPDGATKCARCGSVRDDMVVVVSRAS